jgi:hypothetical protein
MIERSAGSKLRHTAESKQYGPSLVAMGELLRNRQTLKVHPLT